MFYSNETERYNSKFTLGVGASTGKAPVSLVFIYLEFTALYSFSIIGNGSFFGLKKFLGLLQYKFLGTFKFPSFIFDFFYLIP